MSRVDTQQALENVLRNPAIWRAEQTHARYPGIPTAHSALDQVLPDGGWPVGVLTELLIRETGAGELSLLMPALRAICAEERGIALLAAPYLPHARAWEAAGIPLERLLVIDSIGVDLLWAAEQVLRSGECGAVLLWGQAAGRALNHRALQRLHLAANAGNALCFLYRAVGAQETPSPAPLRIRLAAHAGALHVHLVKCRGAMRSTPIHVELFPAHWQPSPVQVLPAAPTHTNASHSHAGNKQNAFRPVLVTAVSREDTNTDAVSKSALAPVAAHWDVTHVKTVSGSSLIPAAANLSALNTDTFSASLCVSAAVRPNVTHVITKNVTTANTTTASTSSPILVAEHLDAAAFESALEPELAAAMTHSHPADAQVFLEPALVATGPQRIAGGVASAGSLLVSETSLFSSAHSQTSVA